MRTLLIAILFLFLSVTSFAQKQGIKVKAATTPSYGTFDLDRWQKKIPYGRLTDFRINDSLNKSTVITGKDFYSFFQLTTTPAHGPGECGCGRVKQLFPGEEFLLNYQGRFRVDPYSRDSVDMITVLSEYKDTTRIYMLTYYCEDDTDNWGFPLLKGTLSYNNIPMTLAMKYSNDTINFESYTEFLEANVIKQTSVWRSKTGICRDSTIDILQMDYYDDMFTALDFFRWKDGQVILDWGDPETGSAWWRDPALKPKDAH